jgi:cytochrome P450
MTKHSLVPFSVGKRDCLGKALADRELTLFFVSLMNQFEFIEIEVSIAFLTNSCCNKKLQ